MLIVPFSEFSGEMLNAGAFARRDGVAGILDYVEAESSTKICGVIGLRRTGKTTMLWQAMTDLPILERERSVYILMESGEMMSDLQRTINRCSKSGVRSFFVDEITWLSDFGERAPILSDYYVAKGLRIVVSGTDSLLLSISARDTLFDRMTRIRTTWMPWREYSRVIGGDFASYVRHGGMMGPEDMDVDEYVRTSIIDNLVDSFDRAREGRFWDNLADLRMRGKIKDAVLRVLNDNLHRFVRELLPRNPSMQEFNAAAGMAESILDGTTGKRIEVEPEDMRVLSDALMERLGYIDADAGLAPEEFKEICLQLVEMDVFARRLVRFNTERGQKQNSLVQPALRWHQASNVMKELLDDGKIGFVEPIRLVREIMTSAIEGGIIEDVVLLDAERTLGSTCDVMTWKFRPDAENGIFRSGEFDMVVRRDDRYGIFEIKKTSTPGWNQARHLRHGPFLKSFGDFHESLDWSAVLYGGREFMDFDGIMWLNVRDFLANLPDYGRYMEEKAKVLSRKRVSYDAFVSDWIDSGGIPGLEDFAVRYLAEKANPEFEMPFSSWLKREGVDIPDPRDVFPHVEPKGLPFWDALQSGLFNASPEASVHGIFEEAGFAASRQDDVPKPHD